jgi:hypothetical protein
MTDATLTKTESLVFRTEQDIVDRIRQLRESASVADHAIDELLLYLTRERAVMLAGENPVAALDPWTPQPADRESVLRQMKEYMPFAWAKAEDRRSLSANRSLEHYSAWTWLLGDDWRFPDLLRFRNYGHEQLLALCRHYGFDHGGRLNRGVPLHLAIMPDAP